MQTTPDLGAQLCVRVPLSLHRRLKIHVVEQQITIQQFLREALTEKLLRERK